MCAHFVQQGVWINARRGNCHLKTGEDFFVKASTMQFGSLFKRRVNWRWNVFQGDYFREVTTAQPFWM